MNNINQQIFNMIGLAKRAAKISYGATTLAKITQNATRLVFVASDASDNTKKRAINKCIHYKVEFYDQFNSDQISQAIGDNNIKVLSINDVNIAKKILSLLTQLQ